MRYARAKELLRQPISYRRIELTLREEGEPIPSRHALMVLSSQMGLTRIFKRPRESGGNNAHSTNKSWGPCGRRMRQLLCSPLAYIQIQEKLVKEGHPRVSLTYLRWMASQLRYEGRPLPKRPHGRSISAARGEYHERHW